MSQNVTATLLYLGSVMEGRPHTVTTSSSIRLEEKYAPELKVREACTNVQELFLKTYESNEINTTTY